MKKFLTSNAYTIASIVFSLILIGAYCTLIGVGLYVAHHFITKWW